MEPYHISFSYFPRNLSPNKANKNGLGFAVQSWNELLQFLAIRLGLAPVLLSEQSRILAYQAALEAAKNGSFYKEFFENEPLGTAKFLLGYRDELKWQFEDFSILQSTQRLRNFSQLEKQNHEWRGYADLFHEILGQLIHVNSLPLTIQLAEPMDLYPSYYQHLFEVLSSKGATITSPNPLHAHGRPNSNLTIFQNRLIDLFEKRNPGTKPQLQADESLIIHHPHNDLLAAAEICEWLDNEKDFECLYPLNAAFSANALASHKKSLIKLKVEAHTILAAQIVQARIYLLQNPVPLENVYDFLSLKLKPFNSILANHIIQGLQINPSLESEEVKNLMEKAYATIEEKYGLAAKNKAQNQYEEWFLHPAIEKNSPINILYVVEKLNFLSKWAKSYSGVVAAEQLEIHSVLHELIRLCHEFKQLLLELSKKDTSLSSEQYVKLMHQWLSNKKQDVGFFTTSDISWANHFVSTETVEQLVWLNFSKNWSEGLGNDKFQKIEYEEFESNGKVWFKKKDIEQLNLYAQICKICSVKEKLKLSFTKNIGSTEQNPHLFWQLIQQEFKLILDQITYATPKISAKIIHKNWNGDTKWKKRFQVENLSDLIPKRTSYSANKNLIYYPHVYLFERLLKLDANTNYTLTFESKHFGTLLHLFIEKYASPGTETYERSTLWDNFSKRNWELLVEEKFEEFVQKNASFLVESKYVMHKNRLKYTLKWKLFNLFDQLVKKGFELIDIEKQIEVENFIQTLKLVGKADMVWKNNAGEYLIIDLKTGSKTELEKELEKNKAWQLMIYAHYGHPGAGHSIAKAAYFLSSKGQFMTGESLKIDNEIVVSINSKIPSLVGAEQMAHYKRALDIRLKQIQEGDIDFRIEKGFIKSLDEAEDNPFLASQDGETDFALENEPFKYDKFTFILPDTYRYV